MNFIRRRLAPVAVLVILVSVLVIWMSRVPPDVAPVVAARSDNADQVQAGLESTGAPQDSPQRLAIDNPRDSETQLEVEGVPQTLSSRVSLARELSGLGELTDDELENLVQLCVSLEKGMTEQRTGFVSAGGAVKSRQFADLTFDIEGASAKANALLEGSYVLLPLGETLGREFVADKKLHIVAGPGGIRDGRAFATHIIIDLQKHGRFAVAKRDLERALEEKSQGK